MRRIHLHGRLADEFAPEFDLDVGSIAETARAMEANFPGRFYRAIRGGAYHIVRGRSPDDGEALDDTMLDVRYGEGDFHIVPVAAGSGGGGGNGKGIATIIIGIIIIAAAIIIPPAGVGFAASFTVLGATITAGEVALMGAALVLSGISTLLTPIPKAPTLATSDNETKPSFFFNGPVNVTTQGGPVPVVYGRMKVGSAVISASLSAEQV